MIYSATACGKPSPALMFDHPDQGISAEWVLQYEFQAVHKRIDGTMTAQCKREEATRARRPEILQLEVV